MDEICNFSFADGEPQLSARSLIIDLMDTGDPASLSVRELVRAGAAFGIESTGIRTALTRLKGEGRVRSLERGLYTIGTSGESLMQRIIGWRTVLDHRQMWRGDWLLAVAGPGERSNRSEWRRTIRALDLEGFAEAATNIWVRPDNLVGGASAARARLSSLDAAPSLFVSQAREIDPERAAQFESLWPGEALWRSHDALAERLDRGAASIDGKDLAVAAAETLLLGRQAIRAIMRDPLLPDSFCPSAALRRLIDAMQSYDLVGKRVWRDYLSADTIR